MKKISQRLGGHRFQPLNSKEMRNSSERFEIGLNLVLSFHFRRIECSFWKNFLRIRIAWDNFNYLDWSEIWNSVLSFRSIGDQFSFKLGRIWEIHWIHCDYCSNYVYADSNAWCQVNIPQRNHSHDGILSQRVTTLLENPWNNQIPVKEINAKSIQSKGKVIFY